MTPSPTPGLVLINASASDDESNLATAQDSATLALDTRIVADGFES